MMILRVSLAGVPWELALTELMLEAMDLWLVVDPDATAEVLSTVGGASISTAGRTSPTGAKGFLGCPIVHPESLAT